MRPLLPIVLLVALLVPLLAACGGGETQKTTQRAGSADRAQPEEPAKPQVDAAEANAQIVAQCQQIVQALAEARGRGAAWPTHTMALENETLNGQVPPNPWTGSPMTADHSFLGLAPGQYSYTQILLPNGQQAGYVLLGYGDTTEDGPDEEATDVFFKARNWVGWNKATSDPRLPNDVPEKCVFAHLEIGAGIGEVPPPDYEWPPQESLVGGS